jgi:hypothetical protein
MRETIVYDPDQAHKMSRAYAKAAARLETSGIEFDQDALATAILMLEDAVAHFEERELGERAIAAIGAHA